MVKEKSTDAPSDSHISSDSYDRHNLARVKSAEYGSKLVTGLPATGLRVQSMRCLRTLTGHASKISTIAVSPDSKLVASSSWDGSIKVWGLRGPNLFKCHVSFFSEKIPVCALGFTSSALRLIVVSLDATVGIWNLATQQCESQNRIDRTFVAVIALSADTALLAMAEKASIQLWNAMKLECLHRLERVGGHVHKLAFSPDSRLMAVLAEPASFEIWDVGAGHKLLSFSDKTMGNLFWSVTFSPDSELIAVGDNDGCISIWSMNYAPKYSSTERHHAPVGSVAFSSDSMLLASASLDRMIKIWDTRTLECLKTLDGHRESVSSVAFTPDGKLLISASLDGNIKFWGTE
jgi:WD40 repeat protein